MSEFAHEEFIVSHNEGDCGDDNLEDETKEYLATVWAGGDLLVLRALEEYCGPNAIHKEADNNLSDDEEVDVAKLVLFFHFDHENTLEDADHRVLNNQSLYRHEDVWLLEEVAVLTEDEALERILPINIFHCHLAALEYLARDEVETDGEDLRVKDRNLKVAVGHHHLECFLDLVVAYLVGWALFII